MRWPRKLLHIRLPPHSYPGHAIILVSTWKSLECNEHHIESRSAQHIDSMTEVLRTVPSYAVTAFWKVFVCHLTGLCYLLSSHP